MFQQNQNDRYLFAIKVSLDAHRQRALQPIIRRLDAEDRVRKPSDIKEHKRYLSQKRQQQLRRKVYERFVMLKLRTKTQTTHQRRARSAFRDSPWPNVHRAQTNKTAVIKSVEFDKKEQYQGVQIGVEERSRCGELVDDDGDRQLLDAVDEQRDGARQVKLALPTGAR